MVDQGLWDRPNHEQGADHTHLVKRPTWSVQMLLLLECFEALPYRLGSLYMVNHCNRKKGPAQKM